MADRALIAGATGLVGGYLLHLLLEHPRYQSVHALCRRPLNATHERLEVHIVDFERLENASVGRIDHAFCSLGTTLKKAGSRAAFRRVDLDYVTAFGRLARSAGAERLVVVSAVGANRNSRFFYNRIKGEVESRLTELGVPKLVLLRPSLLLGPRTEKRLGERLAVTFATPLRPILAGPLARYRPISAELVAKAMVAAAGIQLRQAVTVFESEEIARLALGAT